MTSSLIKLFLKLTDDKVAARHDLFSIPHLTAQKHSFWSITSNSDSTSSTSFRLTLFSPEYEKVNIRFTYEEIEQHEEFFVFFGIDKKPNISHLHILEAIELLISIVSKRNSYNPLNFLTLSSLYTLRIYFQQENVKKRENNRYLSYMNALLVLVMDKLEKIKEGIECAMMKNLEDDLKTISPNLHKTN